MAGIVFPQLGVFFLSREPVRAPAPLAAFATVRAGLEKQGGDALLPGSLSVTTQNRFAIAPCPQVLGAAPESSICEVYEYDPVRFQAMVIGLVEPPSETPVHWIARRVNPQATVVGVVPHPPPLAKSLEVHARPRGYLGDPNTLLALGRLLKGKRAVAIEGTGLVLIGADPRDLVNTAKSSLPRAAPATRPSRSRVVPPRSVATKTANRRRTR